MARLVYLDTCCVIYLLEEIEPFSALIRQHLANNLDAILCVSALVRLESLVKPLIDDNQTLVEDYEIFLSDQQWLTIDDNVFAKALNLRIEHKIKTPDALHLATAIENGCTEFWTNDNRLNEAAKHLAVNIFQTAS